MTHILGIREFVNIPGDQVYELPPLIRKEWPRETTDELFNQAQFVVAEDNLVLTPPLSGDSTFEHRQLGLAENLTMEYLKILRLWVWGDSINQWIRQCEITFDDNRNLQSILQGGVRLWPQVRLDHWMLTLLQDKKVTFADLPDNDPNLAYACKLIYRELPPMVYFTEDFLMLLQRHLLWSAQNAWREKIPDPRVSLPPERFTFLVYGDLSGKLD